jgi:hypothetical protein
MEPGPFGRALFCAHPAAIPAIILLCRHKFALEKAGAPARAAAQLKRQAFLNAFNKLAEHVRDSSAMPPPNPAIQKVKCAAGKKIGAARRGLVAGERT